MNTVKMDTIYKISFNMVPNKIFLCRFIGYHDFFGKQYKFELPYINEPFVSHILY